MSQFFAFNYLVDTYRDYNTWFVGYELDGTMGIGHSKEELDYSNPLLLSEKTTTLNSNLSLEAGIRLGWGRIENISNAWHSYRILNRLHFIDQMDEQASVEQINAFGQFLDDIKTYRIFDARLRDIALLQYIDGYLKDDLGVRGDNIKYFTELNDMYQFGITANRIKGVKYTIIPGISSQYYLLDSEDEIQPMTIRNEDFGYGPKLEFQYLNARPIKRDWQLNFGGNLRSNYLWTKSSRESQVDTERELTFFTVDAEAFALVAFYPTTRTEWTYSTTASIWEGLSKDDGDWDDMDGQFVWDHVFNYTYFVNPYTNWQLSFRTRYQTEGAFRPLGFGVPNLAISTPEGWDIGLDFTFNHIFY